MYFVLWHSKWQNHKQNCKKSETRTTDATNRPPVVSTKFDFNLHQPKSLKTEVNDVLDSSRTQKQNNKHVNFSSRIGNSDIKPIKFTGFKLLLQLPSEYCYAWKILWKQISYIKNLLLQDKLSTKYFTKMFFKVELNSKIVKI